jgi:hypothetical protein
MTKSKMLTALIAVGAAVLTSAAGRHIGWRNAAVAAGIAAGLDPAKGSEHQCNEGADPAGERRLPKLA